MKPMTISLRTVVFSVLATAAAGALAQNAKLPTKLAGTWATPDSRDGQKIALSLEPSSNSAALSLSFAERSCSVRAAPMAMSLLGDRITLKMEEGYLNPCVSDMTLELVPNPGPKGEVIYNGELRLSGSAAKKAPVLRGRLTAP